MRETRRPTIHVYLLYLSTYEYHLGIFCNFFYYPSTHKDAPMELKLKLAIAIALLFALVGICSYTIALIGIILR